MNWRRMGWPLAAGALIIALAGGIAGAGGFGERTDELITMELGQEIDTGNVVYRFTTATAQLDTRFLSAKPWTIELYGFIRNPGTRGVAPLPAAEQNIWAISPADSGISSNWATVHLGTSGDGTYNTSRQVVPPTNQWIEFNYTYYLPADFEPEAELLVGLWPMEFVDPSFLGNSSQNVWRVDSSGRRYRVFVPLTRLDDLT